MGQIIRRDAARQDILAALRKTLDNAVMRKGIWQTLAEQKVTDVLSLAATIEAELGPAEKAAGPFISAIRALDGEADDLLGKIYDDAWNLLGRPQADAFLAVLFPSGSSYYTRGSVEDQPGLMLLLADMLAKGVHSKLPADFSAKSAADIQASATKLKGAIDASKEPRAKAAHLGQMLTAVARVGQIQLSRLKRAYIAEGFSEADIHQVIPDHPREAPKPSDPPA